MDSHRLASVEHVRRHFPHDVNAVLPLPGLPELGRMRIDAGRAIQGVGAPGLGGHLYGVGVHESDR